MNPFTSCIELHGGFQTFRSDLRDCLWCGCRLSATHVTDITHYSDVLMGTMASQITTLIIVNSTVYSGADQRKCPSSASLAFVWGPHRWPVHSPHKWPVTRNMFPFEDVFMVASQRDHTCQFLHVYADSHALHLPINTCASIYTFSSHKAGLLRHVTTKLLRTTTSTNDINGETVSFDFLNWLNYLWIG